jgi:hypothetical protein
MNTIQKLRDARKAEGIAESRLKSAMFAGPSFRKRCERELIKARAARLAIENGIAA